MSEYVRRAAGTPLSDQQQAEVRALAAKPDKDIDFSDIPEMTEEDFRRGVLGARDPRNLHEVTLVLGEATAAWTRANAMQKSHAINFALKQIVQHGTRALRERSEGSERAIYNLSSEEFAHGLALLSGRSVPGSKYVEVPEYADAELKLLGVGPDLHLRPYLLRLVIDAEVFAWLQRSAQTHSIRINYALNHLAHSVHVAERHQSFSKAS